jgi:hypothetical protein
VLGSCARFASRSNLFKTGDALILSTRLKTPSNTPARPSKHERDCFPLDHYDSFFHLNLSAQDHYALVQYLLSL